MLVSTKNMFPENAYEEAIVDEVICQEKRWRVHFEGTFWPARSSFPVILNPGDSVRVVGRDNITLLIEPV